MINFTLLESVIWNTLLSKSNTLKHSLRVKSLLKKGVSDYTHFLVILLLRIKNVLSFITYTFQ